MKWSDHNSIVKLNSIFGLNHTCGYISMLRTDNHCRCNHQDSGSEITVIVFLTMVQSDLT